MFHKDLLANKIALVTGASRGIGQGIALALGQQGATIIGTATTPAGAEKISSLIASNQVKGCGMVLDVTQPSSLEKLLSAIKSQFGAVHILINNAAITRDNLLIRMKETEWLDVINTNLNAIFSLSKMCVRDMLKMRWGRIISIGSVVGSIGNPGQANYCAAKAAIVGFSKALALEVGSRCITINVVAPGYIATDMTRALTDEQQQLMLQRIPMQRTGTVEDIANAVVFLASEYGGYITGQTLHINGGLFMN